MPRKIEEEGEYRGFHTVSTIIHDHVLLVDQGKGKDVLLHEINGEPRYPAAELSKRAGRVITKFIAKEDNAVQDFGTVQSASKEVRMPEEEVPGAVSAPIIGPSRRFEVAPAEEKPSALQVLKNYVDGLANNIRDLHSKDKLLFYLAGVGVTGVILGIISIVWIITR